MKRVAARQPGEHLKALRASSNADDIVRYGGKYLDLDVAKGYKRAT
jgi:hypothetical protein